jgi:hypothetical protein
MKIFDQIQGLASNSLGVVKTVFSIMKLEAKLAGMSIYPFLLNICMLFIVLITLWCSAMVLMGYLIAINTGYITIAIGSVLALNLIVGILLLSYLKFNLKCMSFEKTREYFETGKTDYARVEKTNPRQNHHDGKKIKSSSN